MTLKALWSISAFYYIKNYYKGMIKIKRISKADLEWLISKGYIKTEKGRYIDVIITGKQKSNSKNKNIYTTDIIADKIKFKNK
jgi:hypothetical protein